VSRPGEASGYRLLSLSLHGPSHLREQIRPPTVLLDEHTGFLMSWNAEMFSSNPAKARIEIERLLTDELQNRLPLGDGTFAKLLYSRVTRLFWCSSKNWVDRKLLRRGSAVCAAGIIYCFHLSTLQPMHFSDFSSRSFLVLYSCCSLLDIFVGSLELSF